MKLLRCVYRLLSDGADDWVDMAGLTCIAKWTGGAETANEITRLSFQLIEEVVAKELMVIGDLLTPDGRFGKWDMPHEEAMKKIEKEWSELGRLPSLWEVCWLCNTEKGDKIGKDLVGFWNSPGEPEERLLAHLSFYGRESLGFVEWLLEIVGKIHRNEAKEKVFHIVEKMLSEGLIEIVDPVVGWEMNRWDMMVAEKMKRIKEEFEVHGSFISSYGKICWIISTEKGKKIGVEALEKSGLDFSLLGRPYL